MSAGPADSQAGSPASPKPCPICGKPSRAGYVPFCSKRCADRDLHRWLGGRYGIPGEAAGEEDRPPTDAEDGS